MVDGSDSGDSPSADARRDLASRSDEDRDSERKDALEAALQAAPREQVVRSIEQVFGGFIQRSGGPAYHPIFDKMESSHVSTFLDYTHEEDMEDRAYRKSGRWFLLGYVLLAVAVAVFLILFFYSRDRELLLKLFELGVAFAGGVGTGYGFKVYKDRKE